MARLAADPVELREQVLAQALLAQMDRQMQQMLSQGLVFEIPVPRQALVAVCESIPDLDLYIDRAVALGLLEVSPNQSLRVPRILPLQLSQDAETLHKQAAEILYRLWREEAETATEEQGLEIHRLALRGKVEKIAVEMAAALTYHWNSRSRYREAVKTCEETLAVFADYRILHNLAIAEKELGEVDKAQQNYQQALDKCPAEDETQKATIIHNLANLKAGRGEIDEAIALCQQSLEIKERIGDLQGKAATLSCLGVLAADVQGDLTTALDYLQQSLEIFQRLQSPDAEKVRQILNQVQQLLDDKG